MITFFFHSNKTPKTFYFGTLNSFCFKKNSYDNKQKKKLERIDHKKIIRVNQEILLGQKMEKVRLLSHHWILF